MKFLIALLFLTVPCLAQTATTNTTLTDAELQAARLACNPHARFNGQRQWVYDAGWEQCAKIIDELNRRLSTNNSENERQQMLNAAGRIK